MGAQLAGEAVEEEEGASGFPAVPGQREGGTVALASVGEQRGEG